MDFALILVVLTLVTGLIWVFDALVLAGPRQRRGAKAKEPIVVEYAKSFFPILLIVLVLRSFLFEPFRIPSGSMMPTLLEGDFIFVSKFSYGLRLPVLNNKIVDIGEPRRGDVVVFRLPSNPSINYIKRVVGLPGDVVVYDQRSKSLTINGEAMPIEVGGDYAEDAGFRVGRETLGEVEHDVLLSTSDFGPGGTFEVPAGHYFMMGDNRDKSQDSRFPVVDFVPEDRLVGKAKRVWMNWRWPGEGGPRWSRIGQGIE